jgi:hypothetical protein
MCAACELHYDCDAARFNLLEHLSLVAVNDRTSRTRPVSCFLVSAAALWLPLAFAMQVISEAPRSAALSGAYEPEIYPLLERYCHDCHGAADVVEGDIDLAAMKHWDDAVRQPATWRKVAEMLADRLMPPEEAPQPTDDERARLEQWVEGYLALQAQARAGDPGRVVLRRLSNAEYTYTLRDLTGVKSLDVAREFPVDGAAGEGFTNAGSALVMSPSLMVKYLDAAKDVANDAVLLPDGFRFSPHTTSRDWTDEILAAIRNFYGQFTAPGGGSTVNLQGIVFDTNQDGLLPVEKYLTATLVEREALIAGSKTLEAAAREHGLNAKYFGILWTSLTGSETSLLLDDLRARWRGAEPEDAAALADYVETWQRLLWNFSSVGQIGRVGGPQRWMEPVEPLVTKPEFWYFSLAPIVVTEDTAVQQRLRASFDEFRQLFPPALCYTKIVPVDEVISLTLFYREDDHLVRLMLDEEQTRRLDRLWDELHFVGRDALATVDAFEQLLEYASQDADPTVFEPMRQSINDRAAAFRQRLIDCEPQQLVSLIDFASQAYRRPLTTDEATGLNAFYNALRQEGSTHEEAFRLTLARVLVSPAFLYRIEKPVAGSEQGPVSDWELASRLSYFLWASQPDAELRRAAADGRLHEPEVLTAQARRMLCNAKVRRLAIEFACQWLQIYDFENLDEKSERHFPTFAGLRGAMGEESILFFTDLFQNGGSVLAVLDADYTFLNEALAEHYGIPGVTGAWWRRVEGVKKYSRGGVLAQAATLAKQSGASRTSPILRGTWISEVLLGERLPKPPQGVPPLPDDEAETEGLTMRQLVERHVSDPKCAGCHRRIDPYGFSLEAFDAIGRHRATDLAGRPIDTQVTAPDGTELEGFEGLRTYLLTTRRDAVVRQFCRKLLGYALGRAVQLSDEPLLARMQAALEANDYKVVVAVEAIVLSRQFREIRGKDSPLDE